MTQLRVDALTVPTHAEVYRLHDPDGFVALHRTRLGPAFGGTRLKEYVDPEAALSDALRLSEAMTLKCAVNNIPGGGGKAVLIAQGLGDRERAFRRLGEFVNSLGGRFVTGPDMGVTAADVSVIKDQTTYVSSEELSEHASTGVLEAIRGARQAMLGKSSLTDVHAVVQGLGAVGLRLVQKLKREGARVSVADVAAERVSLATDELELESIPPNDVLGTRGDIFAPCAMGSVIRAELVDTLRCPVVCGAANNILRTNDDALALHRAGICYVPDFLSNSGATIWGALTYLKGPGDYSERVRSIGTRVAELITAAHESGRPPLYVALERLRENIGPPQ